jgi:CMP-N-acetylneuraminic acid synthetase
MDVAREWGVEVLFTRPGELAQDDTPTLPVITHAVEWMEREAGFRADVIALLQPTSPLRLTRHIDEALQMLLDDPEADSVVSVTKVPHQYAPDSMMVAEGNRVVPWMPLNETRNLRQYKAEFLARNGAAIYAFRRECLLEKGSVFGDRILGYRMCPEESIDVDTQLELKICDMLLRERLSTKDVI